MLFSKALIWKEPSLNRYLHIAEDRPFMKPIQIIGIEGLPIVKYRDDLAMLICESAQKQKTPIQGGDIIVITHKVVSRSEGNMVNLDEVEPSEFAKTFAQKYEKDPAIIEVVLRESKNIIRMEDGKLITETKHGFCCANSGVDKSNASLPKSVILLPKDPDLSARKIKEGIRQLTGHDVAIIISDTHGRPLREGEINIAIGVSGLKPIRDRRGETDLFGYVLRVKQTAVADELASTAELVIGQANEGIPVAIIRGYDYQKTENSSAIELIRPKEKDLFI
jgi:coenzyme F420-0:L-glutamate ligase/coenzyme F420-1:gamma-L-glutamate ligase